MSAVGEASGAVSGSPANNRVVQVGVPLVVLGGWLIALPSGVVTLPLRVKELSPDGWETPFSVILGCGWVVMIASLLLGGRLVDRAATRPGGRRAVLLAAVPSAVVVSVLLAFASSPVMLGALWCLLQIPAGLLIATGLGWGGATVPNRRRGLVSGLVGAAPILSIIAGAALARAVSSPATAFWIFGVISAALALPLVFARGRAHEPLPAGSMEQPIRSGVSVRAMAAAWVGFLAADFCISMATSTSNGYAVAFVDEFLSSDGTAVRDLATLAILLASVVGMLASVISGPLSRGLRPSARLFAIGCAIEVIGFIVLLLFKNDVGLVAGAVILGSGFGIANGSEFALVLALRPEAESTGRNLGLLTAVTSLPYVLVPLLAVGVLSLGASTGLTVLFVLAAVFALIGALLTFRISRVNRVST